MMLWELRPSMRLDFIGRTEHHILGTGAVYQDLDGNPHATKMS